MPKMVLEEAKDYDVLPDETMILVEVEHIGEKDVPAMDGREGWTKLEFRCVIRDLPADLKSQEGYLNLIGTSIWGSTTMKFSMHPDNKLRQWAEALLNMGELDAGFELDTDILVHRQAKAVTGSYARKDGTRRHQIDGLLAPGPLGGNSNVPAGLFNDNTPRGTPASDPWGSQPAAQPSQPTQPTQPTQPAVPVWAAAGEDDPPF